MLGGLGLLLVFLLAGEALSGLGLGLPGNVIGMLLLTGALSLGLVKVEQVRKASDTLLNNLAFLFVPPSVGVMIYFDLIGENWPAILVSIVVGAVAVLVAVGVPTEIWFRRHVSRNRRSGETA
jgi:holin-like protein